MGFDGLRFDFSKGYAGRFAGLFSRETVGLQHFAVGEYWKPLSYDGEGKQLYDQEKPRQEMLEWLDEAGEGVAAFDFATKGILQARAQGWVATDTGGGKGRHVVQLWAVGECKVSGVR